MGVNRWAALPIGFGLDIATDPLMMATSGGRALIPKLFKGLKGGGIEGVGAAAKAWGLGKADTLASRVPFVSKSFVSDSLKETVAQAASKAEGVYRTTSGLLSEKDEAIAISQKIKLGDKLQKFWKGSGIPGYKTFEKHFKMSVKEGWANDIAASEDTASQMASGQRSSGQDFLNTIYEEALMSKRGLLGAQVGDDYARSVKAFRKEIFNPPSKGELSAKSSLQIADETTQAVEDVANFDRLVISVGMEERTAAQMANDYSSMDYLRRKVANSPILTKLMNAYEEYAQGFKIMKVSFPGPTYPRGIITDVSFAGAGGYNVFDPNYMKSVMQGGFNLLRGKPIPKEIAEAFATDPKFRELVTTYKPNAAKLGFSEDMIAAALKQNTLEEVGKRAGEAIAMGKDVSGKAGKAGKNADDALKEIEELTRGVPVERDVAGISPDLFYGPFAARLAEMRTGKAIVYTTPKGEVVKAPEWARRNLARSEQIRKTGKDIPQLQATAKEVDIKFAKYKKYLVDSIDRWTGRYNMIDKSFKMGSTIYGAVYGFTASELNTVAKYVKLSADDIVQVGNRYKLSWLKSGEVADETFMNYAVMPNAVKVLRSLPIIGSPFAAFQYSIIPKVAKAFKNNPAFLNKFSYLKNELSDVYPESPMEKVGLGSERYNYLNSYEWTKLPIFEQHPYYLNIANMFLTTGVNPFMSLERKTTNTASSMISSVIDRSPFFKTLEGQTLYDLVIQPLVLREESPTNQFGVPVFRESDTLLDKSLLRPAKALFTGYAPALPVPLLTPFSPFGYRTQSMINAARGRTTQGIATKQPEGSLFIKSVLGTVGLPIQDMDLDQVSSSINKFLKANNKK